MTSVVEFDRVSKQYTRGGPRYQSLRHDLSRGLRRVITPWRKPPAAPARGRLALDDVTFTLSEGDACGIIGPNGAGKTTALRLVTRITYPTGGRVRVRGRVAALIEVGSGIHPELSGRENVWLYGRILGMPRDEIARRFDAIVEFAELQQFLDTPVKMYSSGMQVRLGFAIASHLDPDIFVVDEALAVGDAIFQARCVNRMMQLVKDGKTLLFVTHHLPAVEGICRTALFMREGRIEAQGESREVLRKYLDWVDSRQENERVTQFERSDGPVQPGAAPVKIETVSYHDATGAERRAFHTGEDIEIRITIRTEAPLPTPTFLIGITDGRPSPLVMLSMAADGRRPERLVGTATVSCRMRNVPLLPRVYQTYCAIRDWHGVTGPVGWHSIGSFRITDPTTDTGGPLALTLGSLGAPVHVDHEWAW